MPLHVDGILVLGVFMPRQPDIYGRCFVRYVYLALVYVNVFSSILDLRFTQTRYSGHEKYYPITLILQVSLGKSYQRTAETIAGFHNAGEIINR